MMNCWILFMITRMNFMCDFFNTESQRHREHREEDLLFKDNKSSRGLSQVFTDKEIIYVYF